MPRAPLSPLRVESPWEGLSRAPLRWTLGALLVADAALTAWFLRTLGPSPLSHPDAPRVLLSLGGNAPCLVLVVVLVIGAAVHFALRAGRIVSGLVAILGVGLLVEAQAALIDGPMRFLFFTGATTAGWCFGLLFARWQGLRADDPHDVVASEALAEQGAVAVLAACYLGAFVSKLASSGLSWVSDAGLRATLAAQHAWGGSPLTDRLVAYLLVHPTPVQLLAAFTLCAQASAILLPFGRRGRAVAASLLLTFHTGVWLLTPIAFPQAMVLLAAFGFPWRAPRRHAGEAARVRRDARALERGAATKAVLACALLAAIAWLPGLRAYTQRHHRRHLELTPPPVAASYAPTK